MKNITPRRLMDAAASGSTGWADEWGGPLGVARAAVEAQQSLNEQAAALASLRAAAIQQALETQSLSDVARELGVSKQAISRAARVPALDVPHW